jgi:hypothetical protein
MTEIILSQWVIALALGALCLGLLLFCLVPAVYIVARVRRMDGTVRTLRAESADFKNGLVRELGAVLERLAERQIEASGRQQEQLGKQLSSALRDPLESVVQSLDGYGKTQNEQVARALREQMTTFADRLDQLLGGQVAQAKELQHKTLKSLETTIAAFQDMARTVGSTTEGATYTMIKELRAGIIRSLADTDANVSGLIGKFSTQVSGAVAMLEQQAIATGKLAIEHQQKISEGSERSMEVLAGEVRTQTQAMEHASESMRSVGTDVGHAMDRIIEGMTGLISGAAKEIMRSGEGFKEIFEKSAVLNRDMTVTATSLAASSKEIGTVVSDYRTARESLQGMADLVRKTTEAAKRDTSLTADAVAKIEAAAKKLVATQGQADEYLAKIDGALSEVQSVFGARLLKAMREFQEQLTKASPQQPLSEELQRRHLEFGRVISDWVEAAPRAKQAKPAPPPPPPPAPPREDPVVTLGALLTAKARK